MIGVVLTDVVVPFGLSHLFSSQLDLSRLGSFFLVKPNYFHLGEFAFV